MRLIDRNGLKKKGIDYSDTHLDRQMKAGKFPLPIDLFGGRKHWNEDEVDALIAAKLAARDKAVA
jgi:predicted DNA-binding transcriptional regulator AlpA